MKKLLQVIINLICLKIILAGLLLEILDNKLQRLDFLELAQEGGHKAEKHKVTTEDGYILTVHRIPGDGETIFLQHGIVEASDEFILRGNKSIIAALARKGYDLWLGNFRGNRYSREHLYLSPDDYVFWDFALDEFASFDVPATIDYILNVTNKKELTAIGYSEGTSALFALGSSKPEYNEKIKGMIALGPAAFLSNLKPPMPTLVAASPLLNAALLLSGKEEILNDQSALNYLMTLICNTIPFNYEVCGGTLFTLVGYDPEEVDEEYLKLFAIYYPAGTSRRNLNQACQISLSGRFQRYDYGSKKNKKIYGTNTVPEYNLSRVTMQVELMVGKNDKLTTVEDAIKLNDVLPNSELHVVPYEKMNHIDFLHGEHMEVYLFPLIFNALQKFNV